MFRDFDIILKIPGVVFITVTLFSIMKFTKSLSRCLSLSKIQILPPANKIGKMDVYAKSKAKEVVTKDISLFEIFAIEHTHLQ